ncbi:hypothetical protein BV898_15529 [Hypsibius exemplaris]|uniref:Receptor ligand binding region domain-containing protein n=1 Tax=Hypsibius exemplaris TaxID=2072580 RepID=A0A9X6NB85_HYPEX|nr:hypothetical protein BV898_15529 [Hypsibius exemplaris]
MLDNGCQNFSNNSGTILQVEIITLTSLYPFLLGGLQYVGPAFESAREDIRSQYPKLNFTQTFIYGENAPYSDWLAQYENVLAYYYYRIRRAPPQEAPHVTAFVMAGMPCMIDLGLNSSQALKTAFKCLLIMEPQREPEKKSTEDLQSRWRKLSKVLDNSTYGPGEMMSPHPTATYIAMMALAEVLDEIRQEALLTAASDKSTDAFSGRNVAARFLGRTLANDKTESLIIDRAGERTIPMAVTQLDPETGEVAIILEQDAVKMVLRQTGIVKWQAAWPVLDRPACGFHGETCRGSAHGSSVQYGIGFGTAVLGILSVSVFIYLRISRITGITGMTSWWVVEPHHISYRVSTSSYLHSAKHSFMSFSCADRAC